ncbi:mRNA m6A methyltransferase (MT-A70) family protein [Babesia bovis T2Bo]|uniref:MT-A70 family protein n=2 Tax=Babesia bovis TaxID=5865 RepID=A7AMH3_BABBO|nr:mRNA m6A methyltransferase (MT-A70) family protein [Babesia bovis T2Bo]EDO07757.1 mRNA m6A methyltransferase (MT-A70) family protein [Babesia bovis T2Bo]|eukprot:XP_001611325.1 MT-A70 family protein [Babesia bovis T2Bo]
MGRRSSRSRSPSRRREAARNTREARRNESTAKRAKDSVIDRHAAWKPKASRRGASDVRDKSAAVKKLKEEQAFIDKTALLPVFTTLDLIFVISCYLLTYKDDNMLPMNIYEMRRAIAQTYQGPHRLRFNTVCTMSNMCHVLRHLSMGSGSSKTADPIGLHDATELDDDQGFIDIEDRSDPGEATISSVNNELSSSLDQYFKSLPVAHDESFKEFDVFNPMVQLELLDNVLCVTGVKMLQLRRLIIKNRKKRRVVDLGDDVMESYYNTNDQVDATHEEGVPKSETAIPEPRAPEEGTLENDTATSGDLVPTGTAQSYDLDGLYKVIHQNTARDVTRLSHFQLHEQSGFRDICAFSTKADCRMQNPMAHICKKIHFKRIILPNTMVQLGDCSYLDTCRHIETCRFVHYQVESEILPRPPVDLVSKGQWICCDVRKLDFSIFNPFVSVVMADPPWDIHMDLPYGTMKDSEMKHLKVQNIQNEGLLFLWVTGRTLEVGRECMETWGYRQLDEIVWVKTNQLQRIIRTGRTGHWINHSKEHCLIGIKGNPVINRFVDCDVLVSEVRETSRKPDEIYGLIERVAPGSLKLEIFGRSHNVRNNWITLGNQLDGYKLTHPEIKKRYEAHLAQSDNNTQETTEESNQKQD